MQHRHLLFPRMWEEWEHPWSPTLLAGFLCLPCWRGMRLHAGSRAGLSPLPRVHACNQPLRVMPAW